MKTRYGLLGIVTFLLTGMAGAAGAVEFSAIMVQSAPNQQDMKSRLYVSGGAMREETTMHGQTRIRIHDRSKDVMWLINPDKKEYVELDAEQAGIAGGKHSPPLPDEEDSPCKQPSSGLTCIKMGVEPMNGRTAEKWQFVANRGQQQTEWTEWFDKELRIPIRGEGPRGMVRELSSIQVGPQPATLFQIPEGYKKIEMPTRETGRRDRR